MILFVFFLLYSIIQLRKKHYVAAFMGFLIIFQISLAFLIKQTLELSAVNVLIEVWHLLILYILIKPFEYYRIVRIGDADDRKIVTFSKVIGFMNIVCIVISSIYVVFVWSVVDNYSMFKGQPDVIMDTVQSLPISTKFLSISYFFGSTFFFSLALHFYYLIKGKPVVSILFLILSFSFPLRMLIYFSRSNLILLIILYLFYSCLVFPILTGKAKRTFKLSVTSIFAAIFIVAAIISINRFGEVDKNSSVHDKEGTLYELANYASMWYPNMEVMETYDFNPQFGELSDVLFDYWGLSGGKTNREIREKLWPKHYYMFVPLPTVLAFDFGIIPSFLIICLVSLLLYKLRPKNGVLPFSNFIVLGFMSSLVLMNFAGYLFEDLYAHYALIFAFLIFYYFGKKKKSFQSIQTNNAYYE